MARPITAILAILALATAAPAASAAGYLVNVGVGTSTLSITAGENVFGGQGDTLDVGVANAQCSDEDDVVDVGVGNTEGAAACRDGSGECRGSEGTPIDPIGLERAIALPLPPPAEPREAHCSDDGDTLDVGVLNTESRDDADALDAGVLNCEWADRADGVDVGLLNTEEGDAQDVFDLSLLNAEHGDGPDGNGLNVGGGGATPVRLRCGLLIDVGVPGLSQIVGI